MSDVDLEEELLAVAGRGGKKRSRPRPDHDDEDYDDRKSRKTKKKGQIQKAAPPSEDEEMESDYDDGYGSDLMGDEEDRARLAGLTELDREMELADRAEAREKELERRQTVRALKQQQRKTSQALNMRSSTRAKGVDQAKKSAMAELVAAKNAKARKSKAEEAKTKRREREEQEEEVSDVSEYEVSERSEPEGSEGDPGESLELSRDRRRDELSDIDSEEEEEILTRQPDEDSEEAEYKNVLQTQVRRFMLEKWQNEPFFERSLLGAVVRLAVGGSNKYFMAQIVHVEERDPGHYKDPGLFRLQSPYEFPPGGNKTHKWLYVQRGTSPRLLPMTLISNHSITEEEFRQWQIQCDKDNRPQITLAEVDEVKQRLKDASTYVYTAEDVKKMVEEKRARGEVVNIAREKSRLSARREKAIEDSDYATIEALDLQIAELDMRANLRAEKQKAEKVSQPGKRSLAEVSKQNQLRNMENALRNVGSRPEGSRILTADGVDPFSRRQTRPMNYWSTKKNASGEENEEAKKESTVLETLEVEDVATPRASAIENEFGGIDLNIDLTAIQKSPAKSLLMRRLLGQKWDASLPTKADFVGKKTLTLADYKRRQGIA